MLEGAARPSGDAVFFDVDNSAANPVFRELRGLSLDHDGAVTVEQVDASLASTAGAATAIGSPAREIAPVWAVSDLINSPNWFSVEVAILAGIVGVVPSPRPAPAPPSGYSFP